MIAKLIPVIMCGGSGKRLWPYSNESLPKQFLPLKFNEKYSSFQLLYKSISLHMNVKEIIIVANYDQRYELKKQIIELDLEVKYSIIYEPLAKNTTAAMVSASHYIAEKFNEPCIFLSSDHYFKNYQSFFKKITTSLKHLTDQMIYIFGSIPDSPDTGYGYISYKEILKNKFKVKQFKEKPNFSTAKKFIKKNYLWNMGIFLLYPDHLLNSFKKLDKKNFLLLEKSWRDRKINANECFLSEKHFAKVNCNSIDYSFIEPLSKLKNNQIFVQKYQSKWSDLGSWRKIQEINKQDKNKNIFNGNLITVDSNDNIVISDNLNLVCLVGVSNSVIIHVNNILMVSAINQTDNIKKAYEIAQKKYPKIINNNYNRPWGSFKNLLVQDNYLVKQLFINPGASISLQYHNHRSEHWVVVKGKANVDIGKRKIILKKEESIFIKKGEIHRLSNFTASLLIIIEVQSGDIIDESDITRLQDSYGR